MFWGYLIVIFLCWVIASALAKGVLEGIKKYFEERKKRP